MTVAEEIAPKLMPTSANFLYHFVGRLYTVPEG